MPDNSVDSPQRRKLLAGVGSTAAQNQEAVQATLNNVGASAWEVTNIEDDDELAETGVENPDPPRERSVHVPERRLKCSSPCIP